MIEQELWELRKQYSTDNYVRLRHRFANKQWQHYKGNVYITTAVLWDATQDEWSVVYVRKDDRFGVRFCRTISDWCARPFVGDDKTERFTEL